MPILCLFIKQAKNIYTLIHITITSTLPVVPKEDRPQIENNNIGDEMTGPMKQVYRAMWFKPSQR